MVVEGVRGSEKYIVVCLKCCRCSFCCNAWTNWPERDNSLCALSELFPRGHVLHSVQ